MGSLFVLGATVCWGLENNCTRRISDKSTYQIVTIKGFGSGFGALAVAFVTAGADFEWKYVPLVLMLGFVAYGLSVFTYVRAQNTLGAATNTPTPSPKTASPAPSSTPTRTTISAMETAIRIGSGNKV